MLLQFAPITMVEAELLCGSWHMRRVLQDKIVLMHHSYHRTFFPKPLKGFWFVHKGCVLPFFTA